MAADRPDPAGPVHPPAPPLTVTRPDLPPLDELLPTLRSLWDSRQLTNNGPLHQRLEAELCAFLDVPELALFCNGTIALLAGLRALGLEEGEVITTPFSFVATSHALRWTGLTPVFADIEPHTLTLDPARVAAAITPRTRALLPVHVYGHPCRTAELDALARRHGLKVLYDAAHAFGVREPGLLRAGDLSVLSLHATKVFHTFEGGAVICPDAATKWQLHQIRNFGFVDELTVDTLGINGKLNELQAAVGLAQLPHFERWRLRRAQIDRRYRDGLSGIPGLALPPAPDPMRHNHGYFPVRIGPDFGCSRDALHGRLRGEGIYTRRYFHPLISTFPMYRDLPSAAASNLPVATAAAAEILCLPMYADLSDGDADRVVSALARGAA